MKIAFYDTKPYDRIWFDKYSPDYGFTIKYIDSRLSLDTVLLAKGCEAVCVFVNDIVDKDIIDELYEMGVRVILLRCAGYNNVDFEAAFDKIHVLRVPSYSPHAVAEYAAALLLSVNRKTHRAYSRTRDFNFSIQGLSGFDLHGKTAGIVGTGKIGRIMIDILRGFGMKVIAYDRFPAKDTDIEYVSLDTLWKNADIISLHCPLTPETVYIVNDKALAKMKPGVILINTSRGALVETGALIDALINRKIGGVGLDVYEEEDDYFFEDRSDDILEDESLVRLMSFPNVLITSHQAFFTDEAMEAIAKTTLDNLKSFVDQEFLTNEICYRCGEVQSCERDNLHKNCF